MTQPNITYVKAFTTDPEKGNPVVVIEGDVNSEEVLEAARNAQCSVAAIIDTSKGVVIPTRFFYEYGAQETHACGHATLGAAKVAFGKGVGSRTFVTAKTGEDEQVYVSVSKAIFGNSFVQKQPRAEFRETLSPEDVHRILGIRLDQVMTDFPTQLVGIPGKKKLLVPVSHGALVHMEDKKISRREFCEKVGATGIFPFARDINFADAHARHFPDTEQEDPVCGVGGVALGNYIAEYLDERRSEIHCGPGFYGVGEMRVVVKDGISKLIGKACVYEPLAA